MLWWFLFFAALVWWVLSRRRRVQQFDMNNICPKLKGRDGCQAHGCYWTPRSGNTPGRCEFYKPPSSRR
jgi:hypothetical protein